jgi:hypothetical protein
MGPRRRGSHLGMRFLGLRRPPAFVILRGPLSHPTPTGDRPRRLAIVKTGSPGFRLPRWSDHLFRRHHDVAIARRIDVFIFGMRAAR